MSEIADTLAASLAVVVFDQETRAYLKRHQPKTLEQAEKILKLYVASVIESSKRAQTIISIVGGAETIDALLGALD